MTRPAPFLSAMLLGASALWCATAARSDTPATRPADKRFARVKRDADVAVALDELHNPDWILQYRAIQCLARLRAPEGVQPLQELVTSASARPFVRGRALVALTAIRGPAQLPAALAAAKDPAPALRAAAMEALGLLGSARALPAVTAGLMDKHASVRHQALISLGRLQGVKAWPVIEKALASASPADIRHAAVAMGWTPTDQAGEALIGLLTHADADVRGAAIASLGRWRPVGALAGLLDRAAADSDSANRHLAQAALAGYPAPALRKEMLAALAGHHSNRRNAALRLLADVVDRATADALAELLRQGRRVPADVQDNVLVMLADHDADRYRALFEAGLANRSTTVRKAALRGLGRCEGVDFFRVLKGALADRSSPVRQEALRIVRRRTTGAPPEGMAAWIAPALTSRDRATRTLVQDLLAERLRRDEVPRAIESLGPILRGSDSDAREALAAALARRADEATLRRLASEQGYVTRWQVCGPWPNNGANAGLDVAFAARFDAVGPAGATTAPAVLAKLPTDRIYPPLVAADSAHAQPWRAEAGGGAGWRLTPPAPAKADRTILAFPLTLPPGAEATFRATVLPTNGEDAGAVRLRVMIGATELAQRTVSPGAKPQPIEVPLADWAGREVTLSLVAERSAKTAANGGVILRGPVVRAGDKRVADLAHPKPAALAMVQRDARAGEVDDGPRWLAVDAARADGQVHLHDLMPPPSHYQSALAVADIHSAREREVFLDVQADDTWRAWCNGVAVPAPTDKVPRPAIPLHKGPNRLVVKVTNLRDVWMLAVRLADAENRRADLTQ